MSEKIRNIKFLTKLLCRAYPNLKDGVTCEQFNNVDIEIKPESDNKKEDSRDYFSKKYNLRFFNNSQQEDLHSQEHDLCPVFEDTSTFTDVIRTPVVYLDYDYVVANSNGATHDVVGDIKKDIDKDGEQAGISCSNEDICAVVENVDVNKEQVDSNEPAHEVVVADIKKDIDKDGEQAGISCSNEDLCELVENIDKSTDIIQMPEFTFDDIKRCSEIDEVLMDQHDLTDSKPELCLIGKDNEDECTDKTQLQSNSNGVKRKCTDDNIQECPDFDREQTDSSRTQQYFALENTAECQDTVPSQMNSITKYEQSYSQASNTITLGDQILFDFDQQVTYDADALIYKIVPDSEYPTLFSVQPAFANQLSGFMIPSEGSVALNPCINSEIPHSDNVPDSSISLNDLICRPEVTDNNMRPKECSILLHDVFSEKRTSKRKSKDLPFVFRREGNKIKETSAKSTAERINKKAKTAKIEKEKVAKPKEKRKYKTKNVPKEPRKRSKKTKLRAPIQTSPNLFDDKSLYINDWLQGVSQVTVYNDIDVNELLKDAIIIEDHNIEDDAFELARYMDMERNCTDNLLTNDQNVNNFSDSYTQYLNERNKTPFNDDCDPLLEYEINIDQPIDFSKKQTTPCSTDTGFGNGSSFIEQPTTQSTYHTIMNNQSMDIDMEELISVENNYSSNRSVGSREKLEQRVNQKLGRNGSVTTHCHARDQALSYPAKSYLGNGSSLIEQPTTESTYHTIMNSQSMDIDMEELISVENNYSSNRSVGSREKLGQRVNQKLGRNGSVTTHCHARDQALSYPATNFNKSLGSRENITCQPSKDKLDGNAKTSMHFNTRDQALHCPATNVSESLGSRDYVKSQPPKDKLDENGNASIHAKDEALSYLATKILSKESSSRSCASASNSSKQEDNNKMSLDNDSSIRERSLNNLVIPISMNSTSTYAEAPIVNSSIGQSSKVPIKPKWDDELDYETDLDYEPDESDDNDESSQDDVVVHTSLDGESRSVATPSDNNYVANANNNVQPSWIQDCKSVTTLTNTNYTATPNNNVQSAYIRDCKSVASATNCSATTSNVQPSWIRDCKSVATTSDNQLIQPNQSMPPVLKKAPFELREKFVVKISNNPSNHVSRVVTLCSPLQDIRFDDKISVSMPFVAPAPANITVPLAMQNQKQYFTNPVNVPARPIEPMVAQNQKSSWIPTKVSTNSVVAGGTQNKSYTWNQTNAATSITDHFKTQMLFMFKRPCFNILNNRECTSTCTFNHDPLPSADETLPKILLLENDKISCVYSNFVVRSRTAFTTYFEMMCKAFGLRKMESALTKAIIDCEYYRLLPFFKLIFDSLTQTGLSKRDAMIRMIKYCNQNAASYTTLIEIMIDTDALYFVELLTAYHQRGNISEFIFNLLEQIKVNPAPNLLKLFIDILAKYSRSNVCDFRVLQVLQTSIKDYVYETGDLHLSNRLNGIMDCNNR